MSNRKAFAVRVVVRVTVRFLLPLLLLPLPSACGSASSPYVTTVGVLKPGSTLAIQLDSGDINAYQPAAGQPRDVYTVSATALPKATPPPAPRLHQGPLGLIVRAGGALSSLLVRVPDRVNLVVESQRGNVNVTDITGNVRAVARRGNVDIKVPGYAQALAGDGNISVMMGATRWPGTLSFATHRGDVQLWVVAPAAFTVHLHTDNGTLFTDFGLRGVSSGTSETIDASVNGGSAQRIDVETSDGSIRLLRLQPQP